MEFIIFILKMALGVAVIGGCIIGLSYLLKKLGLYKAAPASQPQPQIDPAIYSDFAEVIMDCIVKNYSRCELCCPRSPVQHMASDGKQADFYQQYDMTVYCYEFDRRVYHAGTRDKEIKQMYSTLPAGKMVATLNSVLPNYCLAYGYPAKKIIDAIDLPNGRVRFAIGPF